MELKTIRQMIFRHLAKQDRKALIDDCLALIIAEIIGYLNKKNADEYGKWKNICLNIKEFKKLTKDALIQKIKIEQLARLDINKKYELLEKKAIYSFKEEVIIFTEVFVENARINEAKLRTDYGSEDYSIVERKNNKLKSDDKITKTIKTGYFISPEQTLLNEIWVEIETEERKLLFPFWKWKVKTTEYEKLERSLIETLTNNKSKETIENNAYKIALYYTEWYKRKYKGNNSEIHEVFDGINPEDIWANIDIKIKTKYLYTINKSERRDDSLRVLGGLPLAYITSEDKNSNLSHKFSKLFRDINSRKNLNVDELGLNNQTMNKSAQNGGSIYEYLNELLNEKYPFAEEDLEMTPFKEFRSFVEGGLKEYKEDKKKKFTINWTVEQHSTFQYIYPFVQIKLKPESESGSNRFISNDRLKKWGIDKSMTHFEIIVRLNFQDRKQDYAGYYFNLCANEMYLSRSGDSWKIPLSSIKKHPLNIEFILKSDDFGKSIQKEEVPSYIQLWNVEFGVWQSRAKNGQLSAVLFLSDNARTVVSDQSETLYTKDNLNNYRWAVINKELKIIDKGKEIKLFQKDGCIEVTPKNLRPFVNAIYYNDEGKVKLVQNESAKYVYLLRGKVEFDVHYIPISNFRSKNKIEEKKEFLIDYKTPLMNDFVEYNNETKLTQGAVKFRIKSEPYCELVECYWLPEGASINRDVYSNTIMVTEIATIGLDNNQYKDDIQSLNENFISINIGVENAFIELQIYRALNRKNDLLIDEKYETTKEVIPIRYANKLTVRVIDTNGLQLFKLSEIIDKYKKLRVIYNNCNLTNDSTGIKAGLPELRTYTKEIQHLNGFYYFPDSARKAIENYEIYEFYFLSLTEMSIEQLSLCIVKINNIEHIGFRLITKKNGIVFQSLKPDVYQETYRPFFVSNTENRLHATIKKEERDSRIKTYKKKFDYNLAIYHFNIAIEHNLYFGMFDILWALEDNPTLLAKFYLEYCSKMKYTEINYKELHRFADEMLFDWMLIPRKVWIEVIGNNSNNEKKEWILNLLKQKNLSTGQEIYSLNQCCERYWNSMLNVPNSNNLLYINIKRVREIDSFFKSNITQRIKILSSINQSTEIYTKLSTTL